MALLLKKIDYADLNARHQENYNFQKVSAVLADYGFVTMRLTDDWQGADFTTQDQTDLIQFLLSLDDDPEVLPMPTNGV